MDKKIRILIISNKAAFPKLDGGSLAIQSLLQIIALQNHIVDIIAIQKNNKLTSTISNPIIFQKNTAITQILFQKNMSFNLFNIIIFVIFF